MYQEHAVQPEVTVNVNNDDSFLVFCIDGLSRLANTSELLRRQLVGACAIPESGLR
jgi:serine/threonine protein phosphatase PrpC